MKRRSFIKAFGGVAGGFVATGSAFARTGSNPAVGPNPKLSDASGPLPKRPLGRTGEQVSIIGFPGNGLQRLTEQETIERMQQAIDRGVNFFDVAPAYGRDGEAEIKMGGGIKTIDREKIFLAGKTKARDKKGAREELERTLKRLNTDYLDLYQMHLTTRPEEIEEAVSEDGCLQTFMEAQKEGKVRYLGFSAHTTLSALAGMNSFKFDTIMFPINYVEHFSFAFGHAVLERAAADGLGVIAIKSTSMGQWAPEVPREQRKWWFPFLDEGMESELGMALRFSLSQKGVVTAMPAAFHDHMDRAITAVQNYRPVNESDMERLKELAQGADSIFMERQQRAIASSNHALPIEEEGTYV